MQLDLRFSDPAAEDQFRRGSVLAGVSLVAGTEAVRLASWVQVAVRLLQAPGRQAEALSALLGGVSSALVALAASSAARKQR